MILDRVYNPKGDEVVYHYCAPSAFLAIVESRSFWFSDAFSLNDYLEIHWGYSVFERAAGSLLEEIPKEFFDEVDKIFHGYGMRILPLVACFSKDGDVLSQWRGYADDGKGFAIGFRGSSITKLPVTAYLVLYDEGQQTDDFRRNLKTLYEMEKERGFSYGKDFLEFCTLTMTGAIALKNPAFREEAEVRLVHTLSFVKGKSFLKLHDFGGTAWGRKWRSPGIRYRLKGEMLVPYVSIGFERKGIPSPITEVVLGPKNNNSISNVQIYLNTVGLGSVSVRKSEASYS